MTTFIKFSNGDTINTSNIQEFRKSFKLLSGPGFGRFVDTEEQRKARTRPAIQVLHNHGQELLLAYESEAERDAEFDRIDAIINSKPQVVFSDLSLNLAIVQSVQVSTEDNRLTITLNVDGAEPIKQVVYEENEAEMANAKKLLAQFGLEMPLTSVERTARMYDNMGKRQKGLHEHEF
jgi:hypothetical protein